MTTQPLDERHPLDRVEVWVCPNRCGWRRSWNTDQRRLDTIIDHPLYGHIRNVEAARADIRGHDCSAYLQARARLMEARRNAA